MAKDKLELAAVLQSISDEIIEADRNAKRRADEAGIESPMFFEECEVDFSVDTEVEVGGGIKVWVLNLGSKAKSKSTNRVKVKYKKSTSNPFAAPAATGMPTEPAPAIVRTATGRKDKQK